MKQRVISAIVGIIILVVVLVSRAVVLDIAVVLISMMAIYEMMNALNLQDHKTMMSVSMAVPVLLALIRFFTPVSEIVLVWVYLVALMCIMLFDHERYRFSSVASFFAATMLISLSFSAISMLRHMENGMLNMIPVFIGSWATDTCAYFSGFFFGKHKLAPVISPKKTVEGSIGGVIGTVGLMLAYAYIGANICGVSVNPVNVVILSVICGGVSQLGDLCASVIKREQGIKDYGNIMPGHGGVMDRFDSVIFAAPVVYYFIEQLPIFI